MGLMILAEAEQSVVLLVLLVATLGLTFWEARSRGLDWQRTAWWMLLVLLTHVIGYLALLGWGAYRKSRNLD